jgi:LPXTG-site transpeptidase (sortase) family protein
MLNSLEKKPLWKSHKKELVYVFLGILFLSLILLFSFGAVPTELEFAPNIFSNKENSVKNNGNVVSEVVLPTHIKISKIGVDVSISNPESDNVDVLDEYLKKGAVHYPGSGNLLAGNMFLFAHSTGLKVVQNQAYKAFNDLKSLSAGDVITVSGEDGKTYLYKVSSVKLATDKDVLVTFDRRERMLTLSTCNTFGQKSERYVVEAYFDSVQ